MRATATRAPGVRASRVLADLAATVLVAALCLGCPSRAGEHNHWSDQNRDGVVDLGDVMLFADDHLGKDWRSVDWCLWLRGDDPHVRKRRLRRLFNFMVDHFECDMQVVAGTNGYPTRLVWAPDGRLYVSDALAGSVFVYESQPQLTAVAEYQSLDQPLGVAVDPEGRLYVGVDGRHRVEVYDAAGFWIATIGRGTIRMPNDLAFDAAGNLYVADSRSNRVWVYDRTGSLLRSIGQGQLRFPVALDVSGAELYVADQGNYQIKVFDLQGNLLRVLGGPVTQGSLGYKWRGKFVRLEAVAVDAAGRLHALDSHQGLIEVLDAQSGAFLASYGEKGTGPGQLSLPMDIAVNGAGEAAVGDSENQRIEMLAIP